VVLLEFNPEDAGSPDATLGNRDKRPMRLVSRHFCSIHRM
jgi:hypothetical protein